MSHRFRSGWVAVLVAAGSAAATTAAEPPTASTAYGDGVQAYFAGNSTQAARHLEAAIEHRPDDPRPYYFRGLCLLRLGRVEAADQQWEIGAALEARSPNRFPIGRSLERVQGHHRLRLEEFRRAGRSDRTEARQRRQRMRYERPAEGPPSEHRRQPVPIPLDALIEPRSLNHWTSGDVPAQPDPFVDDPVAEDAPARAAATGGAAASVPRPASTNPGEEANYAGQKLPPATVLEVFGRVIRRASPLPAVDELRDAVPLPAAGPLPISGGPAGEPQWEPAPGGETTPMDFGPLPEAGEPRSGPAEADQSDPFQEVPFGQ